jgi:hypothetical protein
MVQAPRERSRCREKDIRLAEGRNSFPIAFAAWDGSNNSEKGSRHTMTTWYWLLLKPAAGSPAASSWGCSSALHVRRPASCGGRAALPRRTGGGR